MKKFLTALFTLLALAGIFVAPNVAQAAGCCSDSPCCSESAPCCK